MLIRTYAVTDRESVASLDVETEVKSVAVLGLSAGRFAWRESRLERASTKRHDLVEYLDETPRSWDDGFVAIRDGLVVGFAASAFTEWNRRLVLRHMYVHRPARQRGVGTALLQAVFTCGRVRNAQHVWLETQTDNVPAIRAYERMGFRVVGLDQTFYGDRPGTDTAVFMSQPL